MATIPVGHLIHAAAPEAFADAVTAFLFGPGGAEHPA
jgi:hypothetical protein